MQDLRYPRRRYWDSPNGVAVDSNGDLFATGTGLGAVYEVSESAGTYGKAVAIYPSTSTCPFINTQAVATNGNGRVYVVDSANIWLVAP